MRRFSLVASAALALVALPAHAQTATTATADLNLRAGPGTQYPDVGTIPSGQSVTLYGCIGGAWCDVSYEGQRGWASASFLQDAAAAPTVTYDAGEYFDENYRDRPFYNRRDEFVSAGAAGGAAGGAIAGAAVGGPVGALVGAVAGAAIGTIADPPETVRTYVQEQDVESVILSGDLVVGAGLPEVVELREVPGSEYRFAVVNDRRVLVRPSDRRIVYIFDD